MIIESFVYVPTVFIFNCIATCVLNYRYWKCVKSRGVRPSGVLEDLGRSGLLKMPTVGWIRDQNQSEQEVYLRIEVHANARRAGQVLQHRRIVDEMDLSLINLIDQMIDAVGVVFYMIFWAGNNGWIQTNIHLFMSFYDAAWELSTITQPYIFLLMFPDIRREFLGYYSRNEAVERRLSAIASVEQQFQEATT
ncbi:hypothetical protein M3Y97_00683900 [Aphelenchoides bicaudatus]|nr:hypothetical protein M3Y97_00683900 [Aphelenchoides bicaudatus]